MKIHGWEVIAQTAVPLLERDCIILATRTDVKGPEWVTANWVPGAPEWFWGHYFRNETAARNDYALRSRNHCRRSLVRKA